MRGAYYLKTNPDIGQNEASLRFTVCSQWRRVIILAKKKKISASYLTLATTLTVANATSLNDK